MANEPVEAQWVPIDPDTLRRISERLRQRDVLTPTFAPIDSDLYDPAVYLDQAKHFGTETRLLVDRNLLTRWCGIIRGDVPQEPHRLAAGVLAFAQCAGMHIEPNIALYEMGSRFSNEAARDELALFRIADHVHPGYWADIAIGQADDIWIPDAIPVFEPDANVDFEIKLRRWLRNYILALKLAELELEGGSPAARMSRLLRWMYDDFLLGGPAIALAAVYLAPNADRRRLLKALRSTDREKAIQGVRNAAWDLTLVSEWGVAIDTQAESAQLTLLASLDRGPHRIARAIVDLRDAAEADDDAMGRFLTALWGERVGRQLAGEVSALYTSLEEPTRQINRAAAAGFIDSCIAHGEAVLRNWRPVARNA